MARNDPLPFILMGVGVYFLFFRREGAQAAPPLPRGIRSTPTARTQPSTAPSYIRWVQESLNRLMGCGLAVDGIFGPLTKACLVRFQTMRMINADGVLGPQTDYEIRSALGLPGYTEQPYSEASQEY